jgi:SAM-dependent methyltransferase
MSDTPVELTAELKNIYEARFAPTHAYRNEVWKVLTRSFFQSLVPHNGAVLDLGCGYGEFINNIECGTKYGMDLNPDAARHLSPNVRLLEQDCSAPWAVADNALDVVFTSNFFEHLPDKRALSRTLQQAHRCLRAGGKIIAMGPNIRALPGQYWDFFDHHLALSDRSLSEAMRLAGLDVIRAVPKFLPFTLVDAPRYPLFMLRVYLGLPIAWRVFGRQFLVIAEKG